MTVSWWERPWALAIFGTLLAIATAWWCLEMSSEEDACKSRGGEFVCFRSMYGNYPECRCVGRAP